MQVPGLLQKYKGCLATRNFDEAEKINKEINYFITNEINTTREMLEGFADDLDEADRFEESIPVYFAAASLFEKEGRLGAMKWGGMHGANKKMIARDDVMKEVVKRHVIPLMHDIKNQMLEVTSVSENSKCRWLSLVLEYISDSEALVGNDAAAKETWDESRVWKKRWEGVGGVNRRMSNQEK